MGVKERLLLFLKSNSISKNSFYKEINVSRLSQIESDSNKLQRLKKCMEAIESKVIEKETII